LPDAAKSVVKKESEKVINEASKVTSEDQMGGDKKPSGTNSSAKIGALDASQDDLDVISAIVDVN
jgi:hypothetical protein